MIVGVAALYLAGIGGGVDLPPLSAQDREFLEAQSVVLDSAGAYPFKKRYRDEGALGIASRFQALLHEPFGSNTQIGWRDSSGVWLNADELIRAAEQLFGFKPSVSETRKFIASQDRKRNSRAFIGAYDPDAFQDFRDPKFEQTPEGLVRLTFVWGSLDFEEVDEAGEDVFVAELRKTFTYRRLNGRYVLVKLEHEPIGSIGASGQEAISERPSPNAPLDEGLWTSRLRALELTFLPVFEGRCPEEKALSVTATFLGVGDSEPDPSIRIGIREDRGVWLSAAELAGGVELLFGFRPTIEAAAAFCKRHRLHFANGRSFFSGAANNGMSGLENFRFESLPDGSVRVMYEHHDYNRGVGEAVEYPTLWRVIVTTLKPWPSRGWYVAARAIESEFQPETSKG